MLPGYPVSVSASDWDGGEAGAASIGGDGSNSFRGNLDEIQIFNKVLNQAALTSVAQARHPCTVSVPDHYELSLPTSSITCLPSTVTVTACANTSSPCTNVYTSANGATATLATSGATLGTSTLTFDATGVATTTLSYPAATDGVSTSVTLSGESILATNARTCCANGTSCTVANSCSSTFNTAGFIFSATTTGAAATIPTQVAGTSSGTFYLRAIRTPSTTGTGACVAALSGAPAVNFANQCNNPTTCSATNLMSINGGTATTIAGNPNSGVSSYTSVPMTFDVNGSAPFTFNYSDVGRVTLSASKAASGSLLSALAGVSNAFVVRPGGFVLSNIVPTLNPSGRCAVNPNSSPVCAADGTGARFVKAGESFSATVMAVTSGGTATPNFGKEVAPEGVTLSQTLVAPVLAPPVPGTLNNPAAFGAFSAGSATGTTFNWSEVGIITLSPALTSGNYLGSGAVSIIGTTSGNVGRFYPDHFDTAVIAAAGIPMTCPTSLTCPTSYNGFVYSGQPFPVQVTAKNLTGATTANYQGAFAKAVTLSPVASVGGAAIATATPGGTLSANAALAVDFVAGTNAVTMARPVFTFATVPTVPTDVYVRAGDTDVVSSLRAPAAGSVEGGVKVVSGRIRIPNIYGSELLPLPMTATVQYYNSSLYWRTSTTDNASSFDSHLFIDLATTPTYNLVASIVSGLGSGVVVSSPGAAPVVAGVRTFTLAAPLLRGSADISLNAPTYLPSVAGRATFGIYKSPLIYRRENY